MRSSMIETILTPPFIYFAAVIFVTALAVLIFKRKSLSKTAKFVLSVIIVLGILYIVFIVFLIFMFGSNVPVPPAPVPAY